MSLDLLSLACAAIGALCLAAWPIMHGRKSILLAQLAVATSFAAHYALEGMPTAATLNLLGAVHVSIALLLGHLPRFRWIGWIMIPAILVVCLLTWTGWTSALSTAGTLVIAFGRIQIQPRRLMILVLAGTPFWLAHDVLVGSPLAFVDLFSLVVGITVLYRESRPTNKFATAEYQLRMIGPRSASSL